MKYDMKRALAAGLALLCATAPLYACGNEQAADNNSSSSASDTQQPDPTYTVSEIVENNRIEKLLDHHSAMSYVRTFTDESGSTVNVIRGQYTMKDGFLQMNAVHEDGEGNATYYQQGYADETYGGAEYDQSSDGQTYMTLFESNDSYVSTVGAWLAPEPDEKSETITESSMQDGAVVITTRQEYPSDAEIYDINMYYIDPETNDLLAIDSASYDANTDELVTDVKTEITYDEEETFEVSPYETITGSNDNYCEVNLIVNPQQDDMQVWWYPVLHGTSVNFSREEGVKLYADEEMTQELDPDSIDISDAVRNIFVVKQ